MSRGGESILHSLHCKIPSSISKENKHFRVLSDNESTLFKYLTLKK
jgi:hypothetical protein